MKVKCEIVLDLDTREYEMKFNNLSKPGGSMDYMQLKDMLMGIFKDVNQQIEGTGINSDEQVTKMIH